MLSWLRQWLVTDPVAREYQLLTVQLAPRSSRWQQVRQEHLRQQPECAACGARTNLAVHHIKPYHLFPDLELAPDNLLTLCEGPVVNCHFLYGHCRNWLSWCPNVLETVHLWRAGLELGRRGVKKIDFI